MAYSVLIVDDSKIIRAMVAKTLKLSNLELNEIYEAANGKEALTIGSILF